MATDGSGNTCTVDLGGGTSDLDPLMCDINMDQVIDRTDIMMICAARNTAASEPDDPLDIDGNGTINMNDGRQCVRECTLPHCAAAPE